MKERPILFSAPMVRAILEGTKTQTRRVVKPQPMLERDLLEPHNPNAYLFAIKTDVGTTRMLGKKNFVKERSPFQAGRHLWVRETFLTRLQGQAFIYRADLDDCEAAGTGGLYGGWKPSIFMPRRASRITLEIVSVKIERLNDISAEDAIAEGILPSEHACWCEVCATSTQLCPATRSSLILAFGQLWDSINKKTHPWNSNPFVFVVQFKRL